MRPTVILLLLAVVACADAAAGRVGPGPLPPGVEGADPYVGLRPYADSIEVNARNPGFVGAYAVTRAGQQVPVRVSWTSAAPEIASVDSAGTVVARGIGATVLVATYLGLRAEVRVRTVPYCPVILAISGPAQLHVGDSAVLTWSLPECARVAGQVVEWRSSDTTVVTIDATGRVTARVLGTAQVIGVVQPGNAIASAMTVQVVP